MAASNNALWCDAVCYAHGRETKTTDDLRICPVERLRFGRRVQFMARVRALSAGFQAVGSLRLWARRV